MTRADHHAPALDISPAIAAARRRRSDGIDSGIAAARAYAQRVRIACDELYADPFDRRARAELLKLIVDASPEADMKLVRLLAANGAGSVGD